MCPNVPNSTVSNMAWVLAELETQVEGKFCKLTSDYSSITLTYITSRTFVRSVITSSSVMVVVLTPVRRQVQDEHSPQIA